MYAVQEGTGSCGELTLLECICVCVVCVCVVRMYICVVKMYKYTYGIGQ